MGDWGAIGGRRTLPRSVSSNMLIRWTANSICFAFDSGVLRPNEPVGLPEGTRGVADIRAAAYAPTAPQRSADK